MPVSFEFDSEKAIAAIAYLASKNEDVPELDKYKAAKLFFLADKYHLVRYGRPISGDDYRALEFGPIPQMILDMLQEVTAGLLLRAETARLAEVLDVDRSFKYPRFRTKGAISLDSLSKSDLMALDHVIKVHGHKSFSALVALTHSMAAYRHAWAGKAEGAKMAPMNYEDFFDEEPDAVAGAFEDMMENDSLRRAFPGGL